MTTVTYDIVIYATIDIDADELIDECARDIVDQRVHGSLGGVEIHDTDISAC